MDGFNVSSALTDAQEIFLEIIEPVPTYQPFPCPNQMVIYECRVFVGSTGLTWFLPAGETLSFSIASENGTSRSTVDGKFTAILTGKSDSGTDSEHLFLNSTLQVQPPLSTLNGSVLLCAGGTLGNRVEISTTITLSGMFKSGYIMPSLVLFPKTMLSGRE